MFILPNPGGGANIKFAHIISGGTNSFSKELAEKAGVRINGVSIGTFARDLIEEFITSNDFYNNDELIKLAFLNAKELINKSNKQ